MHLNLIHFTPCFVQFLEFLLMFTYLERVAISIHYDMGIGDRMIVLVDLEDYMGCQRLNLGFLCAKQTPFHWPISLTLHPDYSICLFMILASIKWRSTMSKVKKIIFKSRLIYVVLADVKSSPFMFPERTQFSSVSLLNSY